MERSFYLVLLLFLACATYGNVSLPLSNDWSKFNDKGVPKGWYLNGHAGYQPAPTIDRAVGENGQAILHVSDVRGKSGVGFCHAAGFNAADGDVVRVSARVRGRGSIWFGLQIFHNSKWLAVLKVVKVEMRDEWSDLEVELPVASISETSPTNRVMFTFGTDHGNEIFLDTLNINLKEKTAIEGTQAFPNKWTVFLPMTTDFMADEEELRTVPSALNGVEGKQRLLENNEFDFIPDFGGKKAGNCVWLFAEIDSTSDENYTIAAGADWWMTIWLNGKAIIDTRKTGNEKHPPRMADFHGHGRLHQGKNILALRYVTGTGSASLCLGGPQELRNRGKKLRITQVMQQDDYDHDAPRENLTERIQGVPTEGLLQVTGQGVYQANSPVLIKLSEERYPVPDISSGRYLAIGVRIQNFGRLERKNSRLELLFAGEKGEAALALTHRADKNELAGHFLLDGAQNRGFSLPYDLLPADLLFAVNRNGEFQLTVASLADSSFRSFTGTISSDIWAKPLHPIMRFSPQNNELAEIVIDNFQIVQAAPEVMRSLVPLKLEKLPEFDPVKEGWKLVFADEFDGEKIDLDKWACKDAAKKYIKLNDGFLEVYPLPHGNPKPSSRGSHLSTGSLRSHKQFKYGYFEARVRFTNKRGWWSYIFLYSGSVGNPMLDGLEIDVYEDYYMGGKINKSNNVLDHNLHCYVGGILKSWNYNSTLTGDPDDFHTIGVKWTPFEISYYMDGKLMRGSANHSPHDSITFDAVNHASCIAPLDVRIGANIMSNRSGQFIEAGGVIDEVFKADYVRVYAYPDDRAPLVKLLNENEPLLVKFGERFTLTAIAEPSPLSKAPITGAYLFDGGNVVGYAAEPPYTFTLSIDEKSYNGNAYMRPGRTGVKPALGALHAYSIIVQDSNGQAANTPAILKFPLPEKASTPFNGVPQKVPGVILAGHYDEGGNGVAYYDDNQNVLSNSTWRKNEGVDSSETTIGHILTGEWVRYTVDVTEEGFYEVELKYGTPTQGDHRVIMLIDNDEAGRFKLQRHAADHWATDSIAKLNNIKLTAGEHKITLIMVGAFNFSGLTFKKI